MQLRQVVCWAALTFPVFLEGCPPPPPTFPKIQRQLLVSKACMSHQPVNVCSVTIKFLSFSLGDRNEWGWGWGCDLCGKNWERLNYSGLKHENDNLSRACSFERVLSRPSLLFLPHQIQSCAGGRGGGVLMRFSQTFL